MMSRKEYTLSDRTCFLYQDAEATHDKGICLALCVSCVRKQNTIKIGLIKKGLDEVLVYDPNATGIKAITSQSSPINSHRIYTFDGRYVGTDASVLAHGVYVVGGKKMVK